MGTSSRHDGWETGTRALARLRSAGSGLSGLLRVVGRLFLIVVAGAFLSGSVSLLFPQLLLWSPVPTGWRGTGPDTELTIFAHRGGVREHGEPDNSIAALEAAIARGYDGVEVDVMETRDGVPVVHHDLGLERFHARACRAAGFHVCEGGDYDACRREAREKGVRRCHVKDLSGEEVAALRDPVTGYGVATLEEVLEVAGGAGLKVMLDFKERLSPATVEEVERLLDAHFAEGPVYFIGRTPPKLALARRTGNGRFGVVRPVHPLARFLSGMGVRGEPFLFQWGTRTGRDDLVYASTLGVELIPSVNRAHLRSDGADGPESLVHLAHRELGRLHRLGVRTFQIDSEFDDFFFGSSRSR